jgi:hypothetical protein
MEKNKNSLKIDYRNDNISMDWGSEGEIVLIEMHGCLKREDAEGFSIKLEEILKSFPQDETLKILVNAKNDIKTDYEARRVFTALAKMPRAVKAAVYGQSTFARVSFGFLVAAVGKEDDIKFFETKEGGIEWLKSQK